MRIHIYGTQGSGSVFPRLAEREESRQVTDHQLLERVFEDIGAHAGEDGRLDCTVEEILGAAPGWDAFVAYRSKFQLDPLPVYGGWTTCVHVETADGADVVFDCGSGFRNCSRDLQTKWADRKARTLHLFGSHSHRDHTEGFDQATVCFDPRNTVRVHGNSQFLRALDDYLGIFSRQVREELLGVQSPIHFGKMPATFEATQIQGHGDEGKPFCDTHPVETPIEIGSLRVTPFEVRHPAPCLAYCLEEEEKKFVFCTDHELRRPDGAEDAGSEAQRASEKAEERLRSYAAGADVLYRDGQFLRAEYDGEKGIGTSSPLLRRDWGHSCIEDGAAMAEECGVRRTLIGHHDPNREWAERNWINESLMRNGKASGRAIELARAETVIDL